MKDVPEGKICSQCGIWKPQPDFPNHPHTKDKKLSWCGVCQQLLSKNNVLTRRNAWLTWMGVERYACQKCGYNKCRAVIEFHHKNPENKIFEISWWVQNRCPSEENKKILEGELNKCDTLCSNCHKELHWNERHPV